MPVANRTVARDEIIQVFHDACTGNPTSSALPIRFWDNDKPKIPAGTTGWARITVRHATGTQASLSNRSGQRTWNRTGIVTVQIFTQFGKSQQLSDLLSQIVEDAYDGAATPSNVWFRDTVGSEVGVDGEWFQVNVTSTFNYDEIK